VSLLPRQCGILDISQLYRPSRPVTGIALLLGVVFVVCNVSTEKISVCVALRGVLFECAVLFCVLGLIAVPLPPGETPFAFPLNNNGN
jgi:hypothetical protein